MLRSYHTNTGLRNVGEHPHAHRELVRPLPSSHRNPKTTASVSRRHRTIDPDSHRAKRTPQTSLEPKTTDTGKTELTKPPSPGDLNRRRRNSPSLLLPEKLYHKIRYYLTFK
ncbi:hypothetical protein Rs2_47102 [Raphanus sativus]|nr:hypothetical protein Rs2_47102 [Raphanus sativus]